MKRLPSIGHGDPHRLGIEIRHCRGIERIAIEADDGLIVDRSRFTIVTELAEAEILDEVALYLSDSARTKLSGVTAMIAPELTTERMRIAEATAAVFMEAGSRQSLAATRMFKCRGSKSELTPVQSGQSTKRRRLSTIGSTGLREGRERERPLAPAPFRAPIFRYSNCFHLGGLHGPPAKATASRRVHAAG